MSHTFTMNVLNKTGYQINNLLALHYCDQQVTPLYVDPLPLGGQSPSVSCTTYAGHNDYYLVQFVMNGNAYQANCYCNSDSGSTQVTIVLTESYYDISYNDQNSCSDKSYSYTTA